jgi:hypothetical protein
MTWRSCGTSEDRWSPWRAAKAPLIASSTAERSESGVRPSYTANQSSTSDQRHKGLCVV